MWLFTRYGFFSIACASKPDGSIDPSTVMVRARSKAHLHSLKERFPKVAGEVVLLPERDYRYRVLVSKADWAAVVAEMASEQAWSNFKDEAEHFQGGDGKAYVRSLHEVWGVMYDLQRREEVNSRVEYAPDGVIANAEELTADELAERKVLCPACHRKVFISWPEGWDGHAGWACTIPGGTPEERKANFKRKYQRLFR